MHEYSKTIILSIVERVEEKDDYGFVPPIDTRPDSKDKPSGINIIDDPSNPKDKADSTFIPVYDLEYDIVYEDEGLERARLEGPIPYVKSFSWDGKLTIGWASEIIPYSD